MMWMRNTAAQTSARTLTDDPRWARGYRLTSAALKQSAEPAAPADANVVFLMATQRPSDS